MKIFRAECVQCGAECGFAEMLCAGCVEELPRVKARCSGCGYALSVEASFCIHCTERENGIDHYYSDYYYTGAAKHMLALIKYYWRLRGSGQMGSLCLADGVDFTSYDAVVPIPYHFLRRLMRFRQPLDLMASGLKKSFGVDMASLLSRVRYTGYQSSLTRRERMKNIRNVFRLTDDVAGRKILLIDDVITTGATLREAARVLKKGGAETVDVYTLMAGVPR
jgi:ComF family protein